jgi:hypothetical protein
MLVSDFSFGSDGYGFLSAYPFELAGNRAYSQIIQVRPDGSLYHEQIAQIEHMILRSISNKDVDHALAVGEQSIQVPTERGIENRLTAMLFSYGYEDDNRTRIPAPSATPKPPRAPTEDKRYSDGYYFPGVGHNVRGRFLTYWQQHGGWLSLATR